MRVLSNPINVKGQYSTLLGYVKRTWNGHTRVACNVLHYHAFSLHCSMHFPLENIMSHFINILGVCFATIGHPKKAGMIWYVSHCTIQMTIFMSSNVTCRNDIPVSVTETPSREWEWCSQCIGGQTWTSCQSEKHWWEASVFFCFV